MTNGFAAAVLIAASTTTSALAQYATPRGEVVFPDQTVVRVEIADSPELTARGLMFRKHLGPTEGMVFVFSEMEFRPFWMQNCLIPLDLIWLDAGRRIVSIVESAPPCRFEGCPPPCSAPDCPTYSPTAEAMYVVEVMGGFVKQHGVRVGDRLVFRNIGKRRTPGATHAASRPGAAR